MANYKIAQKLKEARIGAGLTQKHVYSQLGIPQSTFSSWEIGKSEPDADTLIKLCRIYGIKSFSYFRDDDPQQKNPPATQEDELLYPEQAMIHEIFMGLPPEARQDILEYGQYLLSKHKK